MYIPPSTVMKERDAQHAFMQQFSFAILVSDDLTATHLPLLLDKNRGEMGVLRGHMAKANKHWQTLQNQRALIIFNGPHAYVSPTYYASGPAVPTWNYASLHAYGTVTLTDPDTTLKIVEETTSVYEPDNDLSQQRITEGIKQTLLAAIVGFEITLTDIQGKQKLGQQRSEADQQGVYRHLAKSNNINDTLLAGYMAEQKIGTGGSA